MKRQNNLPPIDKFVCNFSDQGVGKRLMHHYVVYVKTSVLVYCYYCIVYKNIAEIHDEFK